MTSNKQLQNINMMSKKYMDYDISALQVKISISQGLYKDKKPYQCTYLKRRIIIQRKMINYCKYTVQVT